MKNKNKKKKSVIRAFVVAAILGVVLGILLTQQDISAHHTDASPCEPVSGVTQAILDPKYGVADAGTLDFDIIEKKGWHNSRACVKKNTKQIEGWVWNTNWGYINFNCRDYGYGVPTSIDGVPCGTVKYGSGVVELPNKSLSLAGYAWADNIGWIHLACRDFDGDGSLENYLYGQISSVNKVNCGKVEYGVSVDGESGALSGYMHTGTMNDLGHLTSVGWMKADGAKIPALKARIVAVDPKTGVENPGGDIVVQDPTAGGSVIPSDPIYDAIRVDINNPHVYANGTDAHLINVKVKRGDEVLGCGDSSVSITPLFTENVDFDQTDGVKEPGSSSIDLLTPVSNIANTAFSCDSLTGIRTAKITSTAPTTALDGTLNTLTLDSITVSADGLLPNVITFNPPRSLDFYPAIDIDIDKIQSQDPQGGWQNKLFGAANTSTKIRATVSRKISNPASPPPGITPIPSNPLVFIAGQFKSTDPSNVYQFWFDKGCNGPDFTETTNPDNTITKQISPTDDNLGINTSHIKNLYAQDFLGAIDPSGFARASGSLENNCLYSYLPPNVNVPEFEEASSELKPVIEYTVAGKPPVRYFTSGSLQAGSVINQFAMVTGGTAIEEFQELVKVEVDTGLRDSLGNPIYELQDVVSNIGKEAVGIPDKDRWNLVKRFAPYLRRTGLPLEIFNTSVAIDQPITEATFSTATANNDRKILYYKQPKGRTQPFKLVLTNPDPNPLDADPTSPPISNIGSPKTIICEGCDAYIDIDVLSPAKIGLIILKDPTITNQTRQGGNIYLCNSVTETNLSIFADGSLYSYGGNDSTPEDSKITRGDTASCKRIVGEIGAVGLDGLPYYGDDDITRMTNMKKLLKNQYTNYGVLRTKNTLGGFAKTPPKTADWKQGDPPADPWKARLQDLNYLRFAEVDPTKVIVDTTKTDKDGKYIKGVLWSEKTEPTLSLGYRWKAAIDNDPDTLYVEEIITQNHPPKVGIVNFIGTDIRAIPILGFK